MNGAHNFVITASSLGTLKISAALKRNNQKMNFTKYLGGDETEEGEVNKIITRNCGLLGLWRSPNLQFLQIQKTLLM